MKKPSLKSLKRPKFFFKKDDKAASRSKSKAKSTSASKFPNIFRFIPDITHLKMDRVAAASIVVFVTLIIIVFIGLMWMDISLKVNQKRKTEQDYQKLTQQITYWQAVVVKHPDYKDAYLQLALLEYQLKDVAKSQLYLQKVLVLDPNSNEAQALARMLRN